MIHATPGRSHYAAPDTSAARAAIARPVYMVVRHDGFVVDYFDNLEAAEGEMSRLNAQFEKLGANISFTVSRKS